MEEILRKVLVKQMDDMVQEMLVKRQVQTLKPPLHMVFDDLMEETVDSLAPQIADLAMEEMIDECVEQLLGSFSACVFGSVPPTVLDFAIFVFDLTDTFLSSAC